MKVLLQMTLRFLFGAILSLGLASCDDGPVGECIEADCDSECLATGHLAGICQGTTCECLGSSDGDADVDGDGEYTGCTDDEDCTDYIFCNGEELCEPELSESPDGCIDAERGPCGSGETCDEEVDLCRSCDMELDADHDGVVAVACGGLDCDDTNSAIVPGAEELPGDEVDQDCDGLELCFMDIDGDGFRSADEATVESESPACDGEGEAGEDDAAGDCDDLNPLVSPSAAELAGDGVDQDCDGEELCYLDADGDGFRGDEVRESTTGMACEGEDEATAQLPGGDCEDSDESINRIFSLVRGE